MESSACQIQERRTLQIRDHGVIGERRMRDGQRVTISLAKVSFYLDKVYIYIE